MDVLLGVGAALGLLCFLGFAMNHTIFADEIAARKAKLPKKEKGKGNTDMPKKIMLWCAAVLSIAATLMAVAFAGGFIAGTLRGVFG